MKPKGKLKFSEYCNKIGNKGYGSKYLKSIYNNDLYEIVPKIVFDRDIQMNQYIKYRNEATN
jgi:hypothetical protein